MQSYHEVLKKISIDAAKIILSLDDQAIDKTRMEIEFSALIDWSKNKGGDCFKDISDLLSFDYERLYDIVKSFDYAKLILHPDFEIFKFHIIQIRRAHSDYERNYQKWNLRQTIVDLDD